MDTFKKVRNNKQFKQFAWWLLDCILAYILAELWRLQPEALLWLVPLMIVITKNLRPLIKSFIKKLNNYINKQ